MNSIRRITQNICRNNCHRRFISLKLRLCKAPMFALCFGKRKYLKIAIASTLIPQAKLNVEDDLRKAVEEGETAILDLMNQLQDLVITTSKQYRNCLTNQIELIKKATSVGHEAWDDLPRFRSLASELSNELNAYLVLLKTIGEMAYDQTLISLMVDKNSLQTVRKKYIELEKLLQHEFEENKLKEQELLEVNIANILSGTEAK